VVALPLLPLLPPSTLALTGTLPACEVRPLLPPTVPASQATDAAALLCLGARDSCREMPAERGLVRVLCRGERGLQVAGVVQQLVAAEVASPRTSFQASALPAQHRQ
jgi:hypothetical protein